MTDQNHIESFGIENYIEIESISIGKWSFPRFGRCKSLPLDDASELLDGSKDITGMLLWRGTFLLGQFIANNESLFSGKKITEVGSGIGLSGSVLASVACSEANGKVILTDRNIDVLNLLSRNIRDNLPTEVSKNVICGRLNWGEPLEKEDVEDAFKPHRIDPKQFDDIDIIIGCDIVYDKMGMTLLFDTVNRIFQRSPSKEHSLIILWDKSFSGPEKVLLQLAEDNQFKLIRTDTIEDRKMAQFVK